MAANNQRAPSAPLPSRWSNNEGKKASKEHQKLILDQVKEMFESILEPDIILSVVQNCKWKLQPSIDALIMLSENAEVPLSRRSQKSFQSSSSTRMSKSLNREGRSTEARHSDKNEYESNLDHGRTASTNSYLNLNDKELQRQQEEFRKFELLKKDLTEKGFVPSENENVSKSSYSQESDKIPHPKLQNFGQNWSTNVPSTGKSDSAKVYFCADVENSVNVNSTTNQFWANANVMGQNKPKETNNQFDNFFGSKLQFSRDLPNNKIGNKGTIPKNCKTPTSVDPAIISARNAAPTNLKTSSTKGSPSAQSGQRFGHNSAAFDAAEYNSTDFSHDFDESKSRAAAQQQHVAQFDSNYDNENKTRAGNSKSNLHKGETESLCGLKVQYRLPGLENSSDDDADVVIEEESADYPTQIPSLMSINVCQFISSSTQSPPMNTRPEIFLTNTPSPPKSPQHNSYDDKLKSINFSILNGYKVLILLRGLPGSGKTYLANSIVKSTVGGDRNQFIFSSDDYFVMLGGGVYRYVRSKLNDAHSYNQKRTFTALREGVSPIIVDNTNTQTWEMQPYVVAGVQNGYIVEVLEPNTPWSRNINELVKKNSHGVPKENLRNMIDRYEWNITGAKLLEQFSLRYSAENFPPQQRKFPVFGEEQDKNEKHKASGSKSRNRRKKKNSNANSVNNFLSQNPDPMNFLLSDSDRNMKHVENSPKSKNLGDTLDNIVSNALKSENDTLNKSLVDYCIETDSGDEIDSDKVPPPPQDNELAENMSSDLLPESVNMEINTSSSPPDAEENTESRTNDPLSSSSSSSPSSSSSSSSATRKISNNLLHQNLGAIGSERKGSVTNLDCENFEKTIEKTETNSKANILSQCWDFTLLVNGRQIHSTYPPRCKINTDFEARLKKEKTEKEKKAFEDDTEYPTGVIITEIVDEIEILEQIEGDKLISEDPDAIINKIINKMDASKQETDLESDINPEKTDVGTELAYEEPISRSEADAAEETGASSFGSIFSMIKKSFMGLNSEEKPVQRETQSEESIMKFKHQTNDNSLSENDAFENEKSHREPSAEEIILEEKNDNESVTTVGDNLSQKLTDSNLSYTTDNYGRDLCEVSKPVTFDTMQSSTDSQFLINATLSGKLLKEKEADIAILDTMKNQSRAGARNQTENLCFYSSIDSDNTLVKNLEGINDPQRYEEDNQHLGNEEESKSLLKINNEDVGIDFEVKNSNILSNINDCQNDRLTETKYAVLNADSVYDILTEAVNRIISRQETESKSQRDARDSRNSISDEDESESSQTESSFLTSRSANTNKPAEAGVQNEISSLLNEEEQFMSRSIDTESKEGDEFSETNKDEKTSSAINRDLEIDTENNPGKDFDLQISSEALLEEKMGSVSVENNEEDYSSVEECCECCEDCESSMTCDINDALKCEDENLEECLITKLEKAEKGDKNEIKTLEIIDNINQVTWKESPFPVPIDSINTLLEANEKLELIMKTDASTNTSNYDFNVLYVGGTSEPEYKILSTTSRTINSSMSLSLPEKPPLKLMLDKSSMTSVVDILSGEESLEFRTEIEAMKDLDELIEMFPNVAREDITEIYKTLCSCNFNWAVDMLLDGVPEDVTKYSKIEAPKISLVDRQASVSDPGDLESQNSTPRKERLDKLKQQSNSGESNDSDSKLQQYNSSPRKKRDRHKVSEESLELKRTIEEKMIINEACYNPHILRVKKWKSGEPDVVSDAIDFKEEKFSPSISIENDEFTRDTLSPKSSESNDDFTEDDIELEEMMELNLGEDFIKVLENEFGNPEFQFPGGLFPSIQIKKSMAQQLHALWIESMEQQLNAQQEQLDKMIEKDAEYARSLEQEEARSFTEPVVPNMQEIMDMEMALAIYHNDLKKQIESETPNDMASRLTRQMLHNMFTDYDPETLDEILKAHNGNFKETVEVLEASTGHVENRNDTLQKQKSLIDRAKKESMQSNEEERRTVSTIVVNPELGQSNNSNSVVLSYDAAMEEAQASRKEAQRQLLLRNENFTKAQEAIRKGHREVAGYYSQMAKLHAKKREWANSTAASAFLAAQDYKMNAENTLDLHYLYVAEALQALEMFLEYQISRLNEGNKKSMNLYIITGRGARSSRGMSRIKPAVSKKLASKNIRFMDENPGCLKIVIHKRSNNTAG